MRTGRGAEMVRSERGSVVSVGVPYDTGVGY